MSHTAITVTGYDPAYLAISEHLVRSEVARGRTPIVMDMTAALAAPVDSYHRGVLRAFGLTFPGHDIRARLMRAGAEYVTIDEISSVDSELSPELEGLLEIATQSALITYFRTDRPNRSRAKVRRIADGLTTEGRRVHHAVEALVQRYPDIASAYVANGRFPHQKLSAEAFRTAGIPTMHIEKGESPGRAYVQEYAPQDRLRSQGSVDGVLDGMSEQQIAGIASGWLAKRAPASDSSNEFSTLWSDGVPDSLIAHRNAGRPIVGFFTSSQDEFQFLGPEWQLHDWPDQMDAFDRILTRFEASGYAAFLRVHPNLATKAHECFLRERDGVRELAAKHPDLTVIWHDDSTSTYALLDHSDAVVVWDSTVGLEASARGLPVWTTATSRYGLVADVRELLSTDDLEQNGVDPWEVDPLKAQRFIAYLVERDDDVITDGRPWTPWDPTAPPLGARLAAIPVAGGIPYPFDAVGSLIDVYRHRRIRANVKARSSR
jgi:hypothetical protein